MTDFWTNVALDGNEVLLRKVSGGVRVKKRIRYRPTLYEPTKEPTGFTTIHGESVKPVVFSSIRAARRALKPPENATPALEEQPKFHGYDRWQYTFLADEYPGEVEYDPSLIRVAIIDIETMADGGFPDMDTADKEVTAITLKIGADIFVFGCRPYTASDPRVKYVLCDDETMLLTRFLDVWSSHQYCPDIVTGWNIESFDIPYLAVRIARVLSPEQAKRLSPWGILKQKTLEIRGKEKTVYDPVGISVLDYLRLYHKLAVMTRAADTPDDYKLNTVAHSEVDEKKIDYSEFEGLHELFLHDWQKYVDYNIHDVLLVDKINDKRQLIELVIAMTYNAKVNYEDMLGSVRPWECIIHHWLLAKKVVLPPRESNKGKELIGAYVKIPDPTAYKWVASFDLNSLYSHLIMEWNISPETEAGWLSEKVSIEDILAGKLEALKPEMFERNVVVAGNMRCFTNEKKGFLPQILQEMYDERMIAKDNKIEAEKTYEMTKDPEDKRKITKWANMDKVHKTNLNAAYGVLTNQWFLFYNHPNAEAITMSGQLAILWVEKRVNEFMNRTLKTEGVDYIIAMDTDSIYVNFGPLVEKVLPGADRDRILRFMTELCGPLPDDDDGNPRKSKMDEVIEGAYRELAGMVNAREQKMVMKRESIADLGIWLGKKHYILNILDKEGVRFKEPKVEIKGMAAVKSSTPPACREKLKESIKLIMTGDESAMEKFISDFRDEFERLPFYEIAFPRSVSDIDKWEDRVSVVKPGTPIQVRAAILYNRYIQAKGLVHFPEVFDKDKIKYAYMRTPNPFGTNVFGTPGPLPSRDIEDYIDRDLMWEKGFMAPITDVLKAVGWSTKVKDESNLFDLFS